MKKDEIPIAGKVIDLRGQKFGRLTVLYRVKNTTKDKHSMWKCQCDCGNICNVTSTHLKSGHTLSCGCWKSEASATRRFKDLTGMRFGKLTVIELDKMVKHANTKIATWRCQCDCDKFGEHLISVYSSNLLNGHTQSCGCLRSKGELKIREILTSNQISFYSEYSFNDGVYPDTQRKMKFDFYVENKYIIEFDGAQHYRSMEFFNGNEGFQYILRHDKLKNSYCFNNNIPMIRIPYWKLDTLLIDDLKLETSNYVIKDCKYD